MDRQAILNQAWQTVDEIKAHPDFLAFRETERQLTHDPVLKELVAAFSAAQAELEPLRRFGTHHPDWKTKAAALALAKDALYARPEHQRYLQAQKRVNHLLNAIGSDLQAVLDECSVSKKSSCQGR